MKPRHAVLLWNKEHPVGTRVRYWPGIREGEGRVSRTRSEAWELCGSAVVMVEGYPGGVALSHVDPLPPRSLELPERIWEAAELIAEQRQADGEQFSADDVVRLALERGLDELFGFSFEAVLEKARA